MSLLVSLLEIPHAIVCINKMDLKEYNEEVFQNIRADFKQFSQKLHFKTIDYLPISALKGDNVVNQSQKMLWYSGKTLMDYLNNIDIDNDYSTLSRFPVQYVLRPQREQYHDFRSYAGMIKSGEFYVGQKVKILPMDIISEVKSIQRADEHLDRANALMSVSITLKDDLDLSRGGMIIDSNQSITITNEITAYLCIMDNIPLVNGKKYLLKHGSNTTKVLIKEILSKVDIHSLVEEEEHHQLMLNEIGKVVIKTSQKLFVDSYKDNRYNGNFILIDEVTNNTVAAGMIC